LRDRDEVDLPDLAGRTILVTGASSGIGRAAALRLAGAGATVLGHGRSPQKMAEVARAAEVAGAGGIEPLTADFTRLSEVRGLADHVLRRTERLDGILHNAGAFYRKRVLTEDGYESTFQTNYLAPFLLQLLLGDLVARTPDSRVVVSTSVAARLGRVDLDHLGRPRGCYRPFLAYATTKLLDILFVQELRRRLAGTSASAIAVHPGAVATNFGAGSLLPRFLYRIPIRKELLIGYFVSTPEQGAEPLVWQLTRSERDSGERAHEERDRGKSLYFRRFAPKRPPSRRVDDPDLARDLWERAEGMVDEWIAPG